MKILDDETKQYLRNIVPDASLVCLKKYSKKQSEEFGRKKGLVQLQIKKDLILITGIQDRKIMFGFQIHYENRFQLIRSSASQNGESLGDLMGIRLICSENEANEETESENEGESSRKKTIEFQGIQNCSIQIYIFSQVLKKKFIVQEGFHSFFKATKRIGKGATAVVYQAVNLKNQKEFAIKSFKKSIYFTSDGNKGKACFLKEFKMMTQIEHPNICKLQGVYQTENSTYVVMELLSLPLSSYILKNPKISTQTIRIFIRDILKALIYLHSKGIMHRDLKLENIMIRQESNQNPRAVLIDFGLAEFVDVDEYLYVKCGTPGYVAPEILAITQASMVKKYTEVCDIFSTGVILHLLLFKTAVFSANNITDVLRKNKECSIDFSHERYNLIGQGKDLLMKMLEKDPKMRITAQQALDHPFLQ